MSRYSKIHVFVVESIKIKRMFNSPNDVIDDKLMYEYDKIFFIDLYNLNKYLRAEKIRRVSPPTSNCFEIYRIYIFASNIWRWRAKLLYLFLILYTSILTRQCFRVSIANHVFYISVFVLDNLFWVSVFGYYIISYCISYVAFCQIDVKFVIFTVLY